jgi:hypothetical protein
MGRKSFKDEIQVVRYLTQLSEPTFKFIQAMYDTGDKKDKQWAAEQMIKLYGKAIPQAGDSEENPIFTAQITGMKIINDGDRVQDEKPEAAPSSEVLA